jgi:hypothetical protein
MSALATTADIAGTTCDDKIAQQLPGFPGALAGFF